MGPPDQQFCAFLRLVIRDLRESIAEEDAGKKQAMLQALLNDLQASLED